MCGQVHPLHEQEGSDVSSPSEHNTDLSEPPTLKARTRSYTDHVFRNVSLILLSVVCLPFTIPIFTVLFPLSSWLAPRLQSKTQKQTITVLVTGVSMQKGLTLARLFHLYGFRQANSPHIRVIGADFSSLAMGSVSRAISKFYTLAPPTDGDEESYVESLLDVIKKEKVDLWVSCSGVASAVEDGVARDTITRVTNGRCRCVQFGEKDTAMLHEKGDFMDAVIKAGLPVPETHVVTDAPQVALVLSEHQNTDKQFIIKPLGVVDKYRADMTKLPLATRRLTQKHVANIPISAQDPFILQEFIDGKEYCTHAVVLKGKVVAFVACESASILMHYVALAENSSLTKAMLDFTTRMAAWAQGEAEKRGDGSEFTGHMSFDFLVRAKPERDGEIRVWPIECNPRTHTAVVLFDGDDGIKMIEAYVKYVQGDLGKASRREITHDDDVVYGAAAHKYYWLPHDLVVFVSLPVLRFVRALLPTRSIKGLSSAHLNRLVQSVHTFAAHAFGSQWRDASLEYWDPLPAWWLWHVYWPLKFIYSLRTGTAWSEVNVSTGKVFGC